MNAKIFLFSLLAFLASSVLIDESYRTTPIATEEFIARINAEQNLWVADFNEGSAVAGVTFEEAQAYTGTLLSGGPELPVKSKADFLAEGIRSDADLPQNFNSIENWPNCPSIGHIRDQSACGSCWAFGAVEAMSDRSCIHINKNLSLSAAGMAFCCRECGNGCQGGFPAAAWQYYVETGVVENGCYPYPFPSCDHHVKGNKEPCPKKIYPNPSCPDTCNAKWSGPKWGSDRHHGKTSYRLHSVNDAMKDIMKNGPVEAAFEVYEDFVTYKSGVYKHTHGSFLGGHAIKIVGWGVENGVDYWLCANSWNTDWGDKGFFKILRGQDECGIEDGIVAGIPLN